MAYTAGNLALVHTGGPGGAKRYAYVTTDSLATVAAADYFLTDYNLLDVGDVIEVTHGVDAVAPGSRTSFTGVTSLTVSTVSSSTVVTQQASGGIVTTTATTLTVTAALHAGKTILVNSAAPIAITLPAATGTGNKYRFVIGVAATATTSTIKVVGTDDFEGGIAIFDTSATDITAIAFAATATDDTITLDGTTKAGTRGTQIDIEDVASGLFSVSMRGAATGSYASPFSATV